MCLSATGSLALGARGIQQHIITKKKKERLENMNFSIVVMSGHNMTYSCITLHKRSGLEMCSLCASFIYV